jgi:PAS domain S-box-containing protein
MPDSSRVREPLARALQRVRTALPVGRSLPHDAWVVRHRALLSLLWLHAAAIPAFGVFQGYPVLHSLLDGVPIAVFAAAATITTRRRSSTKLSSALVALGLLTSSALVVHLWSGQIEGHFHFFVVIALLMVYEDWLPFLLASAYVLVHHGLMGELMSTQVYSHAAGVANPWQWAFIHAAFVAAASGANIITWRLNEGVRAAQRSDHLLAEESQRRFRAAFDDAPIGMGFAALDGRWLDLNETLCRMLGRRQEDLLVLDVQTLTHPDDWRVEDHRLERLRAGEIGSYQMEKRLLRDDGACVTVLVSVSLARDPSGSPMYQIHQMQDVTERKHAEQSLRGAEKKYRTLVEGLPLVVYVDNIDDRSSNVYTSRQIEPILGYSVEEWQTDPDLFVKLLHPDDRERVFEESARAHSRGEPFRADYRLIARDGREVWFHDESVEVPEENGTARYSQGYLIDITERVQLESRLRQAQKVEAVGQLAGGVAHDLNNMMMAVIGFTDFALHELGDAHPGAALQLEQAKSAANRSALLTRQLLAFSRRQVLRPEPLDLNAVVSDVRALLERLIGEDIELRTALIPDLGLARADRSQIEQVIVNLSLNARDAMKGGGTILIETAAGETDEGPHVAVSVTDTGCGMDEATLGRAFEPFFTTKAPGEGTGLGLATVEGIVEQSGGRLTVSSEPGVGTSFTVYLPRVAAEMPAPRVVAPAAPTPSGSEAVLLVEDEALVREVVQEMLESSGYSVEAASTPGEAIGRVSDDPTQFDLLVTDVVMPEMNGRDLAERLTALDPSLRVLYTTGYAGKALDDRVALGSEAAVLQKPFSHDDLARKVREVLDAPARAAA